MTKTLFVGGINFKTTEDTLRDEFAKAGEVVSVKIITDKFSGRSKGFGFVEMADDAAGEAAIAMWHEQELDGRKVIVNEARPKKDYGTEPGADAPAPAEPTEEAGE